GSRDALLRLVGRDILALDGLGRVVAGRRYPQHLAPTDAAEAEGLAVAKLLEAASPDDPWSLARASELYALGGSAARSEQAMARALGIAPDASFREDLWQRHEAILSVLPPGEAAERSLAASERALHLGDVDRAFGFAQRAAVEQG